MLYKAINMSYYVIKVNNIVAHLAGHMLDLYSEE
jgi:hypothetical protein